jgi:hypothetical protein
VGAHSAPRKKSTHLVTFAAVALVALAAWWALFGRGDGRGASQDARSQQTSTEEAPDASGSTRLRQRSATGTLETFEVFASRDPFAPLVGDKDGDAGGGVDEDAEVVKLVDAASDGVAGAQVDVNGTVHTIAEGETFAENFKLLSVSGDCASILYGDDQFTICEGEEIFK